jgi:hypothetical protein
VVSSSYGPPVDSRSLRFASGVPEPAQLRRPGRPVRGRQIDRQPALGPVDQAARWWASSAAGQTFDALGSAPNGGWVLVGQSGYGVGYVAPSLVRPVQVAAASCRVIDASVATSGQRPSAERYSACRDNRGEWQLTQA